MARVFLEWSRLPALALVLCTALAFMAGCAGDEDDMSIEPDPNPGPTLNMSGSWNPSGTFGGPWGHDDNPLVTDHFMVFSGYASTEARQRVADLAEESLAEIFATFPISEASFDFLPNWEPEKIHILALAQQNFKRNSGYAYRDGLVVISDEHENYGLFGFDETIHKRLLKHETYHVVEFLLIGDPQFQQGSDVWMREGMAHYVSRPRPTEITTRQQVEEWRAAHTEIENGGNPIAVHVWSDFPQEILDAGQTFSYYNMFELAVRYLVDPEGHGASMQDIVRMYNSMGNRQSFEAALEQHLGLDLQDFEDNFYQIILAYLDAKAQ